MNTQELVERFKKNMGTDAAGKVAGPFSPLIAGGTFNHEWVRNISKDYGFQWGPFMAVFQEKFGAYFFSQDSYLRTMQVGFAQYQEHAEDMPLMREYKRAWSAAESLEAAHPVASLAALTPEQLQNLLPNIFTQSKNLLSVTLFAELLEKEGIMPYYLEAGGDDASFDRFFDLASRATFESVGLRMDEMIASEGPPQNLQPFLSDYFITPTVEETAARRTRLLADHGGALGMQRDIQRIRADIKKNKDEVGQYRIALAANLQKLFDFIQMSLYVRDVRRKPFNSLFTLASEAARELLCRAGVDPAYAPYALYDELAAGKLDDAGYRQALMGRPQEGMFIYVDQEGLIIQTGGVEAVKQELFAFIDKGEVPAAELKGAVAYKGKVAAKAYVISNEKEFATFERGSVLVTSMTRPEFVPLMKMASAIVTDEGGITCHAAIVSRELKIPCVIGTRNATRVLRTGDMVEVDANTGVVRILQRHG